MKQTIIDVQFARQCDYNALLKRIEALKTVESVSGGAYNEDPLWRKVVITHEDHKDWDTWLYETSIKGLEGYGVCDTTKQ